MTATAVGLAVFTGVLGLVAGVFIGGWRFRDWRTWRRYRDRTGHTWVLLPDDIDEGDK